MSVNHTALQNGGANTLHCTSDGKKGTLSRQDTRNITDVRISEVNENLNSGAGLSKDNITDEIVRHQAFRWCVDSIGGAWTKLTSQDELVLKPIR